MNDPKQNELFETARKRDLTAAEKERLEMHLHSHPEARADWEAEMALTRVLNDLPDVPLSSNFTARVLRAAELEVNQSAPARPGVLARLRSFRWIQYAGAATVITLMAWITWQQRTVALHAQGALASAHTELNRAQLARDAASIHSLAPLPSLDVLQDFEAISRMGAMPVDVDTDLLAAIR